MSRGDRRELAVRALPRVLALTASLACSLGGARPIPVSALSSPNGAAIYDVALRGSVAFVVAGNAVHTFDVSDATAPRPLGVYRHNADIEAIEALDRRMVVRSGIEIQILDVSDPARPRKLAGRPLPDIAPTGGPTAPDASSLQVGASDDFVVAACTTRFADGYGIVAHAAEIDAAGVGPWREAWRMAVDDFHTLLAPTAVAVAETQAFVAFTKGYRGVHSSTFVQVIDLADGSTSAEPDLTLHGASIQQLLVRPQRLLAHTASGLFPPETLSGLLVLEHGPDGLRTIGMQAVEETSPAAIAESGGLAWLAMPDGEVARVDVSRDALADVDRGTLPWSPTALAVDGALAVVAHSPNAVGLVRWPVGGMIETWPLFEPWDGRTGVASTLYLPHALSAFRGDDDRATRAVEPVAWAPK